MADILAGLYTLIANDASVSADIGTRLYPVRAPQQPTLPFLLMRRISEINEARQDGAGSMEDGRFQFDIYAESSVVADRIFRNLRSLLDGYNGTSEGVTIESIFFDNAQDDYEADVSDYKTMADFMVSWQN